MSEYAVIGRVVPLLRGEYSSGETYGINDVVQYEKSLYWHWGAADTLGTPPTDADAWRVILPYQELARRTDYTQTDPQAADYLAGRDTLRGELEEKLSKSGGAMQGSLTLKGICLTENVDYFDALPDTAEPGKLIFVKEASS